LNPKEETMKTLAGRQLRDSTKAESTVQPDKADCDAADSEAADSDAADVGVTEVNAGITEILNMRVGCWRAPVHLTIEPSAA
jgi:hypothetical protein